MRIAVFTLEALAAADAVSRFVADHAAQIGFVGLSDPYRPAMGGMMGQTLRHVRRSGLGFLPYLIANFSVPPMASALGRGPVLPGAVARQLGISVLKIADVNSPATHEALRRHRIDLILSFHFDQIFRTETLTVAPLGGINIHPSLLPHHRGPVPTLHALADGGPFGVTIHRLAAKIDAGGILAQVTIDPPAGLSSIGLAATAHLAALAPLAGVLADLAAGRATEHSPAVLPYRGFPDRAGLARMRAAGVWPANWADIRRGFARRSGAGQLG
ncbi:MAG: formyl transferase [Acetobacteraceae bacterium]|nr:formyl transferase [Acetobacteraceae bacterium]